MLIISLMIKKGGKGMIGDKNEGKSEQVFIIVFISLVLITVVS